MPKSRDPSRYPAAFYDLFQKVIDEGSVTLTGMTLPEARNLRFNLYSFRKAIEYTLPDIALQYSRISMELRKTPNALPTAPMHGLFLVNVDDTPMAKLIAEQLSSTVAEISDSVSPLAEGSTPVPEADPPMAESKGTDVAGVLGSLGFSTDEPGQ